MKAINAAAVNGAWVRRQNRELGLPLMDQMEDVLLGMRETVNPEFRLFITCVAVAVVSCCVSMCLLLVDCCCVLSLWYCSCCGGDGSLCTLVAAGVCCTRSSRWRCCKCAQR